MTAHVNRKIRVSRLAYVHYQHPDLSKAAEFLRDFGFEVALEEENRIYFAGFGIDPYLYIAEKSPDGARHFLGGAWAVETAEDLITAASHPNAGKPEPNKGPGGGTRVTITDPNGNPVHFVFGQELRPAPVEDASISRSAGGPCKTLPNAALDKHRIGSFRRFELGPSPVHKLGHYGYVVPATKYKETLDWYMATINVTPSDSVFDPESDTDTTCFLHIDRGMAHSDHHSFFLAADPADNPSHVHHSSFEVNDFDSQCLGHDYLQKRGWTNCWGVGRHVLGSQIFDYWFDATGNVLEHYSDGDLVNEKTPVGREAEAPNSLYIWGPNIPLAFVTGKVEDAGKPFVPPQIKA